MGSDFDNEESGVSGIKRYWAVLYVFKFYNSNDIFFSCTVTVCPSGSSSCDIVSLYLLQYLTFSDQSYKVTYNKITGTMYRRGQSITQY